MKSRTTKVDPMAKSFPNDVAAPGKRKLELIVVSGDELHMN